MFVKKRDIFLIISLLALPVMLSANNLSSLESVLTEAEKSDISVVYNTKGRTLPLLFNPLASIITSMSITTALKLGLIYTSFVWLLSAFFPQSLVAFGRANDLNRSLKTASFDFDFEKVYSAINTLSEKLSTVLHIPEADCRYRAICETSAFIATKFPSINDIAKRVSGAFFLNLANPYSRAWINGMINIDCSTTYSKCSESPYKTVINKLVAKRR